MKLVVIGCGRVGSAVAREFHADGWDVTAVDEKEEALARLGSNWSGDFVVGHGMDSEILRRAGADEADAVIVATDGDNTNIVVGQVRDEALRGRDGGRARPRPGAGGVLRPARPADRVPDEDGRSPSSARASGRE